MRSKVDCNDENCTECFDSGFRLKLEQQFREKIAKELERKMLSVCICERCDNLLEGRIIQNAIKLVKGESL